MPGNEGWEKTEKSMLSKTLELRFHPILLDFRFARNSGVCGSAESVVRLLTEKQGGHMPNKSLTRIG